MHLNNKTIWQIAAGNGIQTHYAKLCIEKDIVVIGPGKYGPWPECRIPMLADGWTATKAGIIRRFAMDIKPGDIVVLRVGTQHVYGIGEVVGSYGCSNLFGDVQGWDLQHFRRVRWLWHLSGDARQFPPYTLKLGSTVQYMTSPVIRCWIEGLDIPATAHDRPLSPL